LFRVRQLRRKYRTSKVDKPNIEQQSYTILRCA